MIGSRERGRGLGTCRCGGLTQEAGRGLFLQDWKNVTYTCCMYVHMVGWRGIY